MVCGFLKVLCYYRIELALHHKAWIKSPNYGLYMLFAFCAHSKMYTIKTYAPRIQHQSNEIVYKKPAYVICHGKCFYFILHQIMIRCTAVCVCACDTFVLTSTKQMQTGDSVCCFLSIFLLFFSIFEQIKTAIVNHRYI